MDAFTRTKEKLASSGIDTNALETLALKLAQENTTNGAHNLLQLFNSEADKLPWPQDHDFGALVLQKTYRNCLSRVIAKTLLSEAIRRAHLCAKCGTSGGECMARASHWKELKNELLKFP